jgi:hypothetical protein
MEELHVTLRDLQQTVQTLLKKYNNLKKENEQLKNEVADINRLLLEKERLIHTAEERIAANNVAGFFSSEEKELLQSKIDIYLKDIEKCLSMLNA